MRLGRRSRNEPSVRVRQLEAVAPAATPWRLPWPLMTVLAAVVTAAAGWILVTGFCVLGWISVPQIKASAVLQLGTQGWLLAHGISVGLPGAQLSIMPLGLTLLIIAIGLGACQQAVLHSQPPANGQVGIRVARMGLAFGLTYIILIGVGRGWTEGDRAGQASLLTAVVLVFGLGLVASARALGWRPEMPSWVKGAGLAVSAGLAVLVVGGAAVFVAALVAGNNRITRIHDALQPGGLGGVMLLLGQLAWLPNFVLWCGAWATGAGVQLGLGTVISPARSQVGMLPAIPIFGAVPPAGPMPQASLIWLVWPALAGIAAAYVMVRWLQRDAAARGQRLRLDLAALLGALAGIVGGLAFLLLQLLAGGDLGSVRLVDLGARRQALAIMASTSMGLAGMVTGAILGWRGLRGDQRSAGQPIDEAAVHTTVVSSRRAAGDPETDVPTTVVTARQTTVDE